MKYFFFVLFLTSFILNAAENKLKFADELISETDYFRAMTVLKEYEFYNRGNNEGFSAQKKIISIHFKSNDFEMLDVHVTGLQKNYSKFINFDQKELLSESQFFLKNYQSAFNTLKDTQASLEKKYYFRAFTEVETILPECHSDVCLQVKNLEFSSKHEIPKNPDLALALGIIPGLGQIYAGNLGSGIGSLALTTFFSASTIIALNNDEPAFGFASATVGTIFYLSSIYAGYQTALRRNEGYVQEQRKKLKALPINFKLLDLSF